MLKFINKWFPDNTLVMVSSCLGLVGYLLVIDYVPKVIEPARFIIGFCIISVTFPLGRGVTLSMFSKLIGKHKAGVYMGYMLAVGAISRIVGPFWAVQSLTVSPALTFGVTAFLFLINILVQWCYSSDLNPHVSYYVDKYEQKEQLKLNGEVPKRRVNTTTPGSINPMSPPLGYLPVKRSPSHYNKKENKV